MIHRRETFLDYDAGLLEDDEAAQRQVAHDGASDHPRMLIKPFNQRRHVHHHSETRQHRAYGTHISGNHRNKTAGGLWHNCLQQGQNNMETEDL